MYMKSPTLKKASVTLYASRFQNLFGAARAVKRQREPSPDYSGDPANVLPVMSIAMSNQI